MPRAPRVGDRRSKSTLTRQVAERIFAITNDLEEVIDFMARVMRGQPVPVRPDDVDPSAVDVFPQIPSLDQRIDAAEWLAERAIGKAPQTIELVDEVTGPKLDLSKMTTEDILHFKRTLLVASGAPVQ